jgi:hypothetical protein
MPTRRSRLERNLSVLLTWQKVTIRGIKVSIVVQKTDLQQFLVFGKWLVFVFKLVIVSWITW